MFTRLNYRASLRQALGLFVGGIGRCCLPDLTHRFEDLMARNESNTETAASAVAEKGEEEAYQYDIKIEDAGPATKKVVVQIPKERVAEKLTEQFKEIRQQAAIPGFRPGHAPQK